MCAWCQSVAAAAATCLIAAVPVDMRPPPPCQLTCDRHRRLADDLWPVIYFAKYLGPPSDLGLNRVSAVAALEPTTRPPLDFESLITRRQFSTPRCVDERLCVDVAHCTRCILCAVCSARVAARRRLPLPRCRRNRAADNSAQPPPPPLPLLSLCARVYTPASHAKELAAVQ